MSCPCGNGCKCGSSDPPPQPPPMAALCSMINPLNPNEILTFYNTPDLNLGWTQHPRGNNKPVASFNVQPQSKAPGIIYDPSQLTTVMYNNLINVYAVTKTTSGWPTLTQISPGYKPLDVGENVAVVTPGSIAACSDGKNDAWLYYLAQNSDDDHKIWEMNLDTGETQDAGIATSFYKSTALAACYQQRTSIPYVVFQDSNRHITVTNMKTKNSYTIDSAKAKKQTPITACFLLDKQGQPTSTLAIYYIGTETDPQNIIRVTADTDKPEPEWRVSNLVDGTSEAEPTNFTQFSVTPAPDGTTYLFYVSGSDKKANIITIHDRKVLS